MPTSFKARKAALCLIPTLQEGKIYELGSGWGTVLISLAKHAPKAHLIGYELSLIPWLMSKIRLKLHKKGGVTVFRKDFLDTNLSDASLVFCYLYSGAMRKLKKKFEEELPKGAVVISNAFQIPHWQPKQKIEVGYLFKTTLFLYQI